MTEIDERGPQEVERRFWELVEDSVYLLELAEEQEGADLSGSLARSSAVASLMLLEAAANTCIEAMAFDRWVHDEVDRLPILSKYDLFLRLRYPGKSLDRGSAPIQTIRELKKIRDAYAHPKPSQVIWESWTGDEGTAASDETPILHIPVQPNYWRPGHAADIMRAVHSFFRHFFGELCGHQPGETSSLLLSHGDIPDVTSTIVPLLPKDLAPLLERWRVALSYLHVGWV